jgi:Protein of unknown function (DUF1549)/Protein of unknown function (DUF1553)
MERHTQPQCNVDHKQSACRCTPCWPKGGALLLLAVACLLSSGGAVLADSKDPPANVAKGMLTTEDWLKAKTTRLTSAEIDQLIGAELNKKIEPAPMTSDEQFFRRAWLDLAGRLPPPADLQAFLKDSAKDKRTRTIDKLLETDHFSLRWANFWTDVINSRVDNQLSKTLSFSFQDWLADQFKKNASWGEITRELLTATGESPFDKKDNAKIYFVTSRHGVDNLTSAAELAGETSRIFLGIQIQCAQCHNHPFDVWKRQQFHELAAFFVRTSSGPGTAKGPGLKLRILPNGEYKLPTKSDPTKFTLLQPRFIDGKGPGGEKLPDAERRKSLAEAIVSRDNPWFAAAYVNRIWGELLGQSFYQPVDDLGPEKETVMPEVIARLAGGFRGADYDVKEMFRVIMNSETYQRQARTAKAADAHVLFSSVYPRRMDADTLWRSLEDVLGPIAPPNDAKLKKGSPQFLNSMRAQFKQEFGFDPSTRPEEIQGNLSQTLLLMNNPQINQQIKANGASVVADLLKSAKNDDEALRMLFEKVLIRHPSAREMERCKLQLKRVASRADGCEDILWALLNSTEFMTRR